MMSQNVAAESEYYDEPEQLNGNHIIQNQNSAYRRETEEDAMGGYGNAGEEETLVGDQEGDDEDMMDKISSSPSIDDGRYLSRYSTGGNRHNPGQKNGPSPLPVTPFSHNANPSSPFTAQSGQPSPSLVDTRPLKPILKILGSSPQVMVSTPGGRIPEPIPEPETGSSKSRESQDHRQQPKKKSKKDRPSKRRRAKSSCPTDDDNDPTITECRVDRGANALKLFSLHSKGKTPFDSDTESTSGSTSGCSTSTYSVETETESTCSESSDKTIRPRSRSGSIASNSSNKTITPAEEPIPPKLSATIVQFGRRKFKVFDKSKCVANAVDDTFSLDLPTDDGIGVDTELASKMDLITVNDVGAEENLPIYDNLATDEDLPTYVDSPAYEDLPTDEGLDPNEDAFEDASDMESFLLSEDDAILHYSYLTNDHYSSFDATSDRESENPEISGSWEVKEETLDATSDREPEDSEKSVSQEDAEGKPEPTPAHRKAAHTIWTNCLQDKEDIDFDFVYALHTFVATVEGQANCTKGDTMVLLDDSNSYWWLVRVIKDSSIGSNKPFHYVPSSEYALAETLTQKHCIGYLPAEHIETPTERLARLNKHRNIDVSETGFTRFTITPADWIAFKLAQTMLGDNAEKSKNPLKKAMKRRNAKTVQFAPPTYFEPSDVDYSSDEEGGDPALYGDQVDPQAQAQETQTQQAASAVVEPLKIKTSRGADVVGQQSDSGDDLTPSPEKPEPTDELSSDKQGKSPHLFPFVLVLTKNVDEGASSRSRNGVLRNTDSFFKDDTTETRKITLTPNLLRDDSGKHVMAKDVCHSKCSPVTILTTCLA
jgi:hypothetical protein